MPSPTTAAARPRRKNSVLLPFLSLLLMACRLQLDTRLPQQDVDPNLSILFHNTDGSTINNKGVWQSKPANTTTSDNSKRVRPWKQENETTFNYSQPAYATQFTLPDPTKWLLGTSIESDVPSQQRRHRLNHRFNYSWYQRPKLVVLVLSSRENFGQRKFIRESYGGSNCIFVIGGPFRENRIQTDEGMKDEFEALRGEQTQHQDLLDTIHPEGYRSLPHKLLFALQWLARHRHQQEFDFVLKIDGDSVARIHLIRDLQIEKYNPNVPIIIGNIRTSTKKHNGGKNKELDIYKHEYYPPWPMGSAGYVISRTIVEYLASFDPGELPFLQGEDVSLAWWLERGYADFAPSKVTFIDTKEFGNNQNCSEQYVAMGHDFKHGGILKTCYTYMGGNEYPFHRSRIYHQEGPVQFHVQVPN